jgi:hypothetical protein
MTHFFSSFYKLRKKGIGAKLYCTKIILLIGAFLIKEIPNAAMFTKNVIFPLKETKISNASPTASQIEYSGPPLEKVNKSSSVH